MTDKELLRGEIRETIRLYRLGLNKKTLEALVDDMEAIFKQEIEGNLLEKIVVVEVKPDVIRRNSKYKYHVECPSCGKAIVITNSASQRAIQEMIKSKLRKQVEEIIAFLEKATKSYKQNK